MLYSRLGTLGYSKDDVTCSVLAARNMNNADDIIGYSQFEMAAEALVDGKIDAMLVPCAYPKVASFIMDNRLHVESTYLYAIPPLVFVSSSSTLNLNYDVLYNHQATDHLLHETGAVWLNHQNVNSNTTACIEVLRSPKHCCAITNEACARRYGLQIHKILRNKIMMPFIVFVSAELGGHYNV